MRVGRDEDSGEVSVREFIIVYRIYLVKYDGKFK